MNEYGKQKAGKKERFHNREIKKHLGRDKIIANYSLFLHQFFARLTYEERWRDRPYETLATC
jgi:hypothetical protein